MFTEYKKGFISSFFLLMLISISSVCAVMLYKIECEIKSIDNMIEVNSRFADEMKMISFVKCQLVNETVESAVYQIEDKEFYLEFSDNLIVCSDNNGEIMYIYLNNGKIIDYLYKNN